MQKMIYILQKDLPLSKIGEEWMERDGVYYPEFNQFITLPKTFVENNPDWFKKKEPEVCKAEILITDFGTYNKRLDKYPDKVYCINVWHDIIPESKFPAIKKAIEKVLNEEEKPVIDKATKEKYFKQVLECLKHNKVMVDTREDGIYIRLAGSESKGQAFTLHFANAFPYPELQHKQTSETLSDTVLEKEDIATTNFNHKAKIYTTNDMLAAESKAFYAARDKRIYDTVPFAHTYPTFTDYINSKK